jgi:vesicle-associated membrane protein-associated protein A
MREEPPLSTRCKDKFLIQSTIITPEKEALSLQEIVRNPLPLFGCPLNSSNLLQWNVTGDGEDRVHSQKLKVNFLPPEGQTVEEEDETMANDVPIANKPSSLMNHVRSR